MTVTYRPAHGGAWPVKVGYGSSLAEAVHEADAQLRPGEYTRLVVSTPSTILHDLRRVVAPRSTKQGDARSFEGELIFR